MRKKNPVAASRNGIDKLSMLLVFLFVFLFDLRENQMLHQMIPQKIYWCFLQKNNVWVRVL